MSAMGIIYSDHIKLRLSIRKNIPYDLPRLVFEQSQERYYDKLRKNFVAVMNVNLSGKVREVMVAYIMSGNNVILKTTYILAQNEKRNKLKAGRWRPVK
jgi:hypothetical protein